MIEKVRYCKSVLECELKDAMVCTSKSKCDFRVTSEDGSIPAFKEMYLLDLATYEAQQKELAELKQKNNALLQKAFPCNRRTLIEGSRRYSSCRGRNKNCPACGGDGIDKKKRKEYGG